MHRAVLEHAQAERAPRRDGAAGVLPAPGARRAPVAVPLAIRRLRLEHGAEFILEAKSLRTVSVGGQNGIAQLMALRRLNTRPGFAVRGGE